MSMFSPMIPLRGAMPDMGVAALLGWANRRLTLLLLMGCVAFWAVFLSIAVLTWRYVF